MTIYPTSALRAVALRAQGLHTANGSESAPTRQRIYEAVDGVGCVQIDTLHMVRRSQYLVLWSRLGKYDPADFDALTSPADRRLFEGWQHAATIIPLTEYRYQMVRQRRVRETPATYTQRWIGDPGNAALAEAVLERIRKEGALRTSDFEGDGRARNSWWDWKPAKHALEHLFATGDLAISDRTKFQRLYDLTGRVLPEWVDLTEPSIEERDRFWVEQGAKALGVCSPRHAGDYTWMKVTSSRPRVADLLSAGALLPIQGRLADRTVADLIVHKDNLRLLEQAADGGLPSERTTFLSPFDSLFWANRRDEQFWNFHQSLEAYLPAPKRTYGYFCLPILHHDRFVGRFDPKLVRKTGTLILRSLYLEPGVKSSEELVEDVATAMQDFMAFHDARELVIENSQPAIFGKKLMKAL
ncbi:MAG TPA: crosslink repair DNA glycosylase YcaQ family protein [Anaerolineales bacterium]|nr:crosslink repair DNA glycosylase YcaQ family protein [Anaerolineales bacterium]